MPGQRTARRSLHRTASRAASRAAIACALAAAGLLATAAPAVAAVAADGGHTDGVAYGYCVENVRIHTQASTGSTTKGICAKIHRIRTNASTTGGPGTCPNGRTSRSWSYARDLNTDVAGWILGCYIKYYD